MPRRNGIILFLSLLTPLGAAILPEGFEQHTRISVQPIQNADQAVWSEYGLQEAERATYSGKGREFSVSAWRLQDATAAQAAWQMLRPANAKPDSELTHLAARSGSALLIALGNYVLRFDGYDPLPDTLNQLMLHMPRFQNAALPSVTDFIPAEGLITNSERYILGPASLERFVPKISPSAAAFQFGVEGQAARFKDRDGEVSIVLLAYPNHQIAQKQLPVLENIADVTVRRSGPLVAVVTEAASPDAAQRVLARVRYQANVTLNEKPKAGAESLGDMLLAIVKLIGLLLAGCLVGGLLFAGFRLATGGNFGGFGRKGDDMVSLSLNDDAPSK